VPGVIVTQHSGEGKANQYFLRGFNLDHGTDFATTVAGVPDACARARVFGPQFPDSRAGQRCAVFEGSVLRGSGGLRNRRVLDDQLRRCARQADRARRGRWSGLRARRVCGVAIRGAWSRRRGARSGAQRRPVDSARAIR
jgi:hypothetical protein